MQQSLRVVNESFVVVIANCCVLVLRLDVAASRRQYIHSNKHSNQSSWTSRSGANTATEKITVQRR